MGALSCNALFCSLTHSSSLLLLNQETFLLRSSCNGSLGRMYKEIELCDTYCTLFRWQQIKLGFLLRFAVFDSSRHSLSSHEKPPFAPKLCMHNMHWIAVSFKRAPYHVDSSVRIHACSTQISRRTNIIWRYMVESCVVPKRVSRCKIFAALVTTPTPTFLAFRKFRKVTFGMLIASPYFLVHDFFLRCRWQEITIAISLVR